MLPGEARLPRRPAVVTARTLRGAALALAALALLPAAACSDDEEGSGAPAAGESALTVTLDADGKGGEPARVESVECAPDDDSAACAALERLSAADLAPAPPGTACTQIFGGPEELTVEGVLRGEEVAATLTRADGCEIERFDAVVPLLGELFPGYSPGQALG